MRKPFIYFLFLVCLITNSSPVTGAIIPSGKALMDHHSLNPTEEMLRKIAALSPRQFERATGRHLTFKERISYRLLQWKLRSQLNHPGKHDLNISAEKQANLSLYMGIGAWVLTLIAALGVPFIGIFGLSLAIAAVILGGISVNKVQHKARAIWGIILGGSYLFLLLLLIVLYTTAIGQL